MLLSDTLAAMWECAVRLPDIPPHFSREAKNLDFQMLATILNLGSIVQAKQNTSCTLTPALESPVCTRWPRPRELSSSEPAERVRVLPSGSRSLGSLRALRGSRVHPCVLNCVHTTSFITTRTFSFWFLLKSISVPPPSVEQE